MRDSPEGLLNHMAGPKSGHIKKGENMTKGMTGTITTRVRELEKYIGRKGQLFFEGGSISCPVEVIDSWKFWDRIDVLVKPVGGTGKKWVEAAQIDWDES